MPTTIISNAAIVLPDTIKRTQLTLCDGRVVAEQSSGAWELYLRDHFIFPGLINAHDHLHLNNVPPLPQREPFPNSYAWIASFQGYFDDPAVARAVAVPKPLRYWQGGLKNLLCGATTVAHHDPWHPALDDPAFPVGLLRDFGWSHSLGLGNRDWRLEIGDRCTAISNLQSPYGPPVAESFAATPASRPWIIHVAEGTDDVAAAELDYLER